MFVTDVDMERDMWGELEKGGVGNGVETKQDGVAEGATGADKHSGLYWDTETEGSEKVGREVMVKDREEQETVVVKEGIGVVGEDRGSKSSRERLGVRLYVHVRCVQRVGSARSDASLEERKTSDQGASGCWGRAGSASRGSHRASEH